MLNLKCEGISLWGNFQQLARWESTRKFLKGKVRGRNVLDIGPENEFGKAMATEYGLNYWHTEGDLDKKLNTLMSIQNKEIVIFCFDVLEHLMNPLLLLKRLRKYNAPIFVSHPYRKFDFLWGNEHFHEFRPEAFKTLLYEAGYEIIESQKTRMWGKWWFYLTGIRPFLRFLVVLFGWSTNNIYLVKRK